MRKIGLFLIVLFFALSSAAQNTSFPYYDTFARPWLNPAKWLTLPTCSGTIFLDTTASVNALDCAREIQNNKLHLMVKAYGLPASDEGRQFGPAELFFANPNAVNSISANLQVRKMEAVACSSNSTRSLAQVILGGNYFNQGSDDPTDDVAALIIIEHDPTDPARSMRYSALVFSPHVFYGFTPLGSIIFQEQVTATIRWDKGNHAFFFSVASDTLNASTTIAYSGSDNLQPSVPAKLLAARAFVADCTTRTTWADADVVFSNVSVN